ncbi:FKBP-type peptidyl-prolyl cis-trans isomerase [Haloglomus salinum]|jgi:FKBP-type peptidyl-prolyl cis-trans isomerase SlyD|uniref:FKBP-type peptidyl-prolyl cis-trans isomerase n=1 Tax=Haloglomus salinum TaxID=2962673 RepID=UPI0020C9CBDD|nr:peptidylprolyl isomerase [Haloglomus salinum]
MSEESDEDVEETEAETEEEVAEPEAESEADEEEPEGLQDGDFVRIDYTARTVEGDQLVDTTDPEVAEEEGVADQGTFEPRVIVLGAGHLFESVEDDIIGGEAGDSGTVTIPAEEAFGEYDEERVRTVSADKIDEDDRYPGARVQIDGEQGVLETIVGGRARVDFNHPLAGEEIEYDYEILEEVTDQLERAQGLFGMFLDMELEMHLETDEVEETHVEEPDEDDEDAEPETVTETVEKLTLYVESNPQLSMNQQWMMQKTQIAQEIIEKTGIDRIIVQDILDGSGGMMGGMGGMMGGMGGGAPGGEDVDEADIEAALEEADIDADEIAEEIE